jgi:hypothetical protein
LEARFESKNSHFLPARLITGASFGKTAKDYLLGSLSEWERNGLSSRYLTEKKLHSGKGALKKTDHPYAWIEAYIPRTGDSVSNAKINNNPQTVLYVGWFIYGK